VESALRLRSRFVEDSRLGRLALLIVAILVVATLVMPSRLARFWDSLVPPEVVLADLKPLRPEEEAAIAAHLPASLHAQIDRLRQGLRLRSR